MREFKFFHGINRHKLTAIWEPELNHNLNLYDDIVGELGAEINQEIDRLLLENLSNNNLNYLNHYINMGGGNRA